MHINAQAPFNHNQYGSLCTSILPYYYKYYNIKVKKM